MPDLTPSRLAADLVLIVGATLLASLALAAVALFSLRRRAGDRALLAFTGFASLYATRLVASTTIVPDIVGGDETMWHYLRAILTYVMPIPLLFFAEQLLGPGRYGAVRHLRRVTILFACIAIPGSLLTGEPYWAIRANRYLVFVMLLAIPLLLPDHRGAATRAMKVMRGGVIVAAFFVLAENLRAANWLAWPSEVEFIGFVALAASLAYSVTERFLANEGRLVAIERELETARRIQQAILPRDVPTGDGFRVTARYIPMTAVAGDFYDFALSDDGALEVLVADVSGHGVPAALIASMVKVAASSHRGEGADPGRMLTQMNHTLDGQLGGQFVTAICLYLERRAVSVAFAGAGHPPILHWQAGAKQLARLDSTGMIFGPFPAAAYGTGRQPVAAGDRLTLYTDGLLEATDAAGRMFGDERFPALLCEHAARTGPELADIILAELTAWSGKQGAFDDDVTLVIVDVL